MCPRVGRPTRVSPHSCLISTTIANVLLRIPATALAAAAQFVPGSVSFTGTNTSDPGPGLGSVETNIERRRLRISPLAHLTLTRHLTALKLNPQAAPR